MDVCARSRKILAKEFQKNQKLFIALGDTTRQDIFITLLENEKVGMRVPEITIRTHLSRPAVSHHLRILKDAGLINMHRVGTMNYYYVDADRRAMGNLKKLVDLVDAAVKEADENSYPRLQEDKQP